MRKTNRRGRRTRTEAKGARPNSRAIGCRRRPDQRQGGGSSNEWTQTFEGLTAFDDGDLPAKPKVAKGYDLSDDKKTYTFHLKEGVKFHDGSELTAHDFVYSWTRLAESPNSRNTDDILGGTFTVAHETKTTTDKDGKKKEVYKPETLAVKAVDDHTFRFTLAQPFHDALAQIAGAAFTVVPKGIVGDIDGVDGKMSYEKFSSGGAAGTGPFEIHQWSKGDEFVVKRFDDYHGDVAKIDGIRWTILGSDSSTYNRAMNGNLDVFSLSTSKFEPKKRKIEKDHGTYRRERTAKFATGRRSGTARRRRSRRSTCCSTRNASRSAPSGTRSPT